MKFNLTWPKLIIFAILAGAYTALVAILPITKDTSFADISISFEVWILFGIIIIMGSKSAKDSALKCFVFFLISQPLIYLIQVPFSTLGWSLFGYYKYWFIWTLLTIPMGFIGWYIKKDKWWGLLILAPILVLLGYHYSGFLSQTIYRFPYHLLSTIFCVATLLIYPIAIFRSKKIKLAGTIISVVIIIASTVFALIGKTVYNTTILVNGGEAGAVFDDNYKASLEDESFGKVYIVYNEALNDYVVNAEFKKAGKTNIILEDVSGNREVYEIDVKSDTYDIVKK